MNELPARLSDLADSVPARPSRATASRTRARRIVHWRHVVAVTAVCIATVAVVAVAAADQDRRTTLVPIAPGPTVTGEPAGAVHPVPGASPLPSDHVYCGGSVSMATLSQPGGVETEDSEHGRLMRDLINRQRWPPGSLGGTTNWIFLGEEPGYVRFGHRVGPVGIDRIAQLELKNGVFVPGSLYGCGGMIMEPGLQAERLASVELHEGAMVLHWSAGSCGPEVRVVRRVELTETPERVYVRLVTAPDPNEPTLPPGQACWGTGTAEETRVVLGRPLGTRQLFDTWTVPATLVDTAK
jgi:hypothetical protein